MLCFDKLTCVHNNKTTFKNISFCGSITLTRHHCLLNFKMCIAVPSKQGTEQETGAFKSKVFIFVINLKELFADIWI